MSDHRHQVRRHRRELRRQPVRTTATARHGLHQRLDDRPRHRLHQAPLPAPI